MRVPPSEMLDADGVVSQLPAGHRRRAIADAALKAAVLVGAVALVTVFAARSPGGLWGLLVRPAALGRLFELPATIAASLLLGSYVYRSWLWFRYRPIAPTADSDALPTVTVVIPAYNEGPMVRRSILSALSSDYPADRLRVIAVDDGSQDDTLVHMRTTLAVAPDRIEVLTLGTNRGKRHALYAGMKRAQGDIVVTLDSDSVLAPDAIRHLVAPFVARREVGAVAGRVGVYNRYENLLTRMLAVRYLLGFEFTRAYQSELNTVLCCPGALTAYRRSALSGRLEAWRDQVFLGNRCTNGDDHALTNAMLRDGHATLYQRTAVVHTIVPTTYKKLSKMYTRWARSNIRESLRYMRFAVQRAVRRREGLAFVDAAIHFAEIPMRFAAFAGTGWLLVAHPGALLRGLAACSAIGLLYLVYYLRSERSSESILGILYAWFAAITLQWIYPWAALTVRTNRWMTRGR